MSATTRMNRIGLAACAWAAACTVDAPPYPQRDGALARVERDADVVADADASPPSPDAREADDAPVDDAPVDDAPVDDAPDAVEPEPCAPACTGFQTCLDGRCGCEMAALTPGAPLRGVDMRAGRTPANACSGPSEGTGNAVYFRVPVPARSRVTLRAAPRGAPPWQPTIRVYDSCAQLPPCWAYRSAPSAGATAVLAVDNEALLARDFTVAVSPQAGDTAGTLDMIADVTPLPGAVAYALTTIPGACDDTARGRLVELPGAGSTWASPITSLPFPFTYFGQSVGYYSVTSSGFAQLWTSGSGTPLVESGGRQIEETTEGLDGVIAAFWDGLRPQAMMGSSPLRAASLGDAPQRRFVIDWDDWRFDGGDQHLRFQIKLFETTGAIELHYCTLSPSDQPRVLGSAATIGLTRPSGAGGALVAYRAPYALRTANAFRLTPQM